MIALPPPFICHVAYVKDGDTWTCDDGQVVRAARIDAPELPGHCRAGRHCAPGDPFEARQALVDLVDGQNIDCTPVSASPRGGSAYDRYGRIVATCSVNGTDIGEFMLAGGLAVRWPHE